MSQDIEAAIKHSDWPRARRLVRAALGKEPDSHWLITRLSLTYYEEREYERSLDLLQRAYEIAPRCPLVLWDLVGTFDMLGRYEEAISVYQRLLRRGVTAVAFGDCGEGIAWARGLLADCWYRLAQCQKKTGQRDQAVLSYKNHLQARGPGCRSIYPLQDVRHELALTIASK